MMVSVMSVNKKSDFDRERRDRKENKENLVKIMSRKHRMRQYKTCKYVCSYSNYKQVNQLKKNCQT